MRAATVVLLTILSALPMTARSQRGAPEDVLVRASAGFPMSVTYTYAWMFEPPYHPTLALELDHIHTIRLTLTESEGGWDVVASWQSSRASERTPRRP